jgi:hypothetical protein
MERFTRTANDTIEYQVTVEAPDILAEFVDGSVSVEA